jgi:hypothetical protein
MRKRSLVLLAVFLFGSLPIAAQTVDEIIAKSITARWV